MSSRRARAASVAHAQTTHTHGRQDDDMRATVRNMRRCETAGIRAEMFDLVTRESYSATSGDYFWQDDDTPFSGCVLVTRTPAQLADIAEADLA